MYLCMYSSAKIIINDFSILFFYNHIDIFLYILFNKVMFYSN